MFENHNTRHLAGVVRSGADDWTGPGGSSDLLQRGGARYRLSICHGVGVDEYAETGEFDGY